MAQEITRVKRRFVCNGSWQLEYFLKELTARHNRLLSKKFDQGDLLPNVITGHLSIDHDDPLLCRVTSCGTPEVIPRIKLRLDTGSDKYVSKTDRPYEVKLP